MTEFTEKLNSSELVSKAWDEIDRDQANVGLLIDTISNEFKDWQPPKEPVVFPSWMPSTTDSLLDIIDKQLVAIPQLVADFIESENNNEENREGTLVFEHYNSYKGNGNRSELHEWIADNFNDFLEAIVNGYTVEKPKENLYVVKLPCVPTLNSYMCKSCSPGELGYNEKYSSKNFNEVRFGLRYYKKYSGGWQRQFTEQEIKDIDPRYLAFSVKVEED